MSPHFSKAREEIDELSLSSCTSATLINKGCLVVGRGLRRRAWNDVGLCSPKFFGPLLRGQLNKYITEDERVGKSSRETNPTC